MAVSNHKGRKPGDGKGRMGGRPPGTPNKDTAALVEAAERLKVDPFEVLLLFAKGDWKALGYRAEFETRPSKFGDYEIFTIDPSVRAKCAAEACQYLHPKRKAIELTGAGGEPLSFTALIAKAEEGHE